MCPARAKHARDARRSDPPVAAPVTISVPVRRLHFRRSSARLGSQSREHPIAHDEPRDVEPGGDSRPVASRPSQVMLRADAAARPRVPGANHAPGEIVEHEP